jgi:glyoxylase I family protein
VIAQDLAAHLEGLETRLLRQDVRADAAALTQLIADDFFEFGVCGTLWTRDAVIEALRGELFSSRRISDFRLTCLADGVALVTYRCRHEATAEHPATESLRSSIWRLRDSRWQMLFHQGTPL